MKRPLLLTAVVLLACPVMLAADGPYKPTWESLDARPLPAWFNRARFGVFVCWGPYCVPGWAPKGRYAEWYGNRMRNPRTPTYTYHVKTYGKDFPYEKFGPMMTGANFSADAWADLFAKAGAKYVVVTANYHDGFCLWPSPYRKGWNAMDTGPQRDVLGQIAAATRKAGLTFGIYYSLYEWYHPLWLSDRDRYVREHLHPQFKDVVSRYKPKFIFADGEWEMDYRKWRSEELLAWLFNESPVKDTVVVNDRWGKTRGKHGSIYESEYGGGNMGPRHAWQEDRGMGRSYGYNRNETEADYDSPATLLQMLTKCAGNGGNYLVCVGPKADGTIPKPMRTRLLAIGTWLKTHGEAIYDTQASPFWPRKLAWGTCTYRPGAPASGTQPARPHRIYAHVYSPAPKQIDLPGLTNEVQAAYLLADPKKTPLAVKRAGGTLVVVLPPKLPDPHINVVVLETADAPHVDTAIRPGPDGRFVLRARDAVIHGHTPRYERGGGKDNIGYWNNPKDYVSWTFQADKSGEFDVSVTYSCAAGFAGSEFAVVVGKQKLTATSEATGAWNRFHTRKLGRIRLDHTGKIVLEVRPKTPPKWKVIGLQSATLTPAK